MAEKKIAIIDDEKDIILLLSIELQGEGYEVITASDGEAGLKVIQEELPDLVLLDIMMPKVDGFEVLKALRDNAETRKVPVILLSERNSTNDIQQGRFLVI